MFSSPADPVKSIEALYVKLHDLEEMQEHYETKGWTSLAKLNRNQMRGVKATITRYSKLI